tara:strand:- start:730 stop:999 length:270 start_codon:yes stop_codon:yes gene_type:complete
MKNKRLKFNSGELVYHKDFNNLNTKTKFSTTKDGKINYNINTGTDKTRLNLNKTNRNKSYNLNRELKNNKFIEFDKAGKEYSITFGKKF